MSRNPEYQFVETDPGKLEELLVRGYEEITGRTAYPASPERVFIQWAEGILLHERVLTNYTGNQNIPSRAEGENLDALAELLYLRERPGAKAAVCTQRFHISEAQKSAVLVPAGTRVTCSGGPVWETVEDVYVPIGETHADVQIRCQTLGAAGNGYTPGQLNALIDVYDYYSETENITASDGGADAATEVPSQASSPSFLLEFYGFLAITNGVQISVDLSTSGAVVTPQYLAGVMERHDASPYTHLDIRVALEQIRQTAQDAAEAKPETGQEPPGPQTEASPGQHYFDAQAKKEYICVGQNPEGKYIWVLVGDGALEAHDEDPSAHPGLRDAWGELDSRLALLELMFTTDVTGNPFTVTFDTLTGLAVTGIWNAAQKRLEF